MGNPTLLRKFVGMVAYPPGSIYITIHHLNVEDLHEMGGGTGSEFAPGKCLFGYQEDDEDFNIVEQGKGAKNLVLPEHSHTVNNHTHSIDHGHYFLPPTVSESGILTAEEAGAHTHTVTDAHPRVEKGGPKGDLYYTGQTSTSRTTSSEGTHQHNIPSHTHTLDGGGVYDYSGNSGAGGPSNTNSSGDELIGNENLPPYITVYMYKRDTLY